MGTACYVWIRLNCNDWLPVSSANCSRHSTDSYWRFCTWPSQWLTQGKADRPFLWRVTDVKLIYPHCVLFECLLKHSATQHLCMFSRILVSALLTSHNRTLFFIETVQCNWSLPVGLGSHSFTYVIKFIKIKYGKIWSVEMYFTTINLDIIKI
jgi:hypothetical protein